jgi:deoxyribonuclease-1
MKLILLLLLLTITPHAYSADIPSSFSKAKKLALTKVYKNQHKSFYCGCTFNNKKQVDQASCGYTPRTPITSSGKENVRDNRIEWEHVLPASKMGSHLACWGSERKQYPKCVKSNGKLKSGRDCCQKVNKDFRNAHNDLVNLTPAIGEVNADRSNLPYQVIKDENRSYGQCDFEYDPVNKVVEPAKGIRGDIARIQLYLLNTYGETLGFKFSNTKHSMLEEWNDKDPVSDWELERNKRICEVQGRANDLVSICTK